MSFFIREAMETVTAFSALITAIILWRGVSVWKKEYTGKRKLELAESLKALFYEVEEAIIAIRSPLFFEGEAKERKTPKERYISAVVLIRYDSRKKVFCELQAIKNHAKAVFGHEVEEPFNDIKMVIHKICRTARKYAEYVERNNRDSNAPIGRTSVMEKWESIFWSEDNDEIAVKIREAVKKIEKIVDEKCKKL